MPEPYTYHVRPNMDGTYTLTCGGCWVTIRAPLTDGDSYVIHDNNLPEDRHAEAIEFLRNYY